MIHIFLIFYASIHFYQQIGLDTLCPIVIDGMNKDLSSVHHTGTGRGGLGTSPYLSEIRLVIETKTAV